ncbi:acyl-CoA dehydrogenase [Actinomadura livida]|uniref:Acyl-CoA dehydrogenase family protein n=1 Tax=Actinomadura livida TaxID=79909 RepID=A0A7W7MXL6_9ACTN|nr:MULTISPECIES: acyl-CoA dehydrogenase [Actinomadura]MBB4774833.1 alkylation response protein AidB-like acyl-CoA dehydrogenase [Actinomadura catellatispora]GGU05698.1 acyl-CoA dehydrogenase [Actinomadura livida]
MSAAAEERWSGSTLDSWRDLVLTDERRELAETVRRQFAGGFPLEAVRACFDGGSQPEGAWTAVSGAEYPSIGLPESAGGLGTLVDTAALLEAAGEVLVSAPLLATVMSLQTLARAGALPLEPARPAALAVADGPVAGRLVVLDGVLAERLTVVVPRERGVTVAQFDTADLGPAEEHRHVDPSRPVAVFDAGEVPPLSHADDPRPLDAVLAPARTALAADLTGTAAGALDRAVRHALDREQFGRKIGAFQAVKHRLADVYIAVERARSLTRAAAVALAGPSASSGTELSLLAKAAASEAAVDASRALVQVLGAMGMTFESDAHLFFRRAQQTAPFLGSAAACYRRAVAARRGVPA